MKNRQRFNIILLILCRIMAIDFVVQECAVAGRTGARSHVLHARIPAVAKNNGMLVLSEQVKAQAYDSVKALIAGLIADGKPGILPDLFVLDDSMGRPIIPNPEFTSKVFSTTLSNELSFRFDSPRQPWNPEEIEALARLFQEIYPKAKDLYGSPAFSIMINVRRDTSWPAAAAYSPTLNEIIIKDTLDKHSICHELIHAFRDDFVLGIGTYEEGMTVAAEIEVLHQLSLYPFMDNHHSGDFYYEIANRPSISAKNGNVWASLPLALTRYRLSGYVWAKAYLEDETFFRRFNSILYSQVSIRPTLKDEEEELRKIVALVKPAMEGLPIGEWYTSQHILNTRPTSGYRSAYRIDTFLDCSLYCFLRNDNAGEAPFSEVPFVAKLYDDRDSLLEAQSGVTSAEGIMTIVRSYRPNELSRLKIVWMLRLNNEILIEDTLHLASTSLTKDVIFGVVTNANGGTVTVTLLNSSRSSETVPIRNGCFTCSSFIGTRGTYRLDVEYPDKQKYSRCITKDAAPYFVLITKSIPKVTQVDQSLPSSTGFGLEQNYPNPFNPRTSISYELPRAARVSLKVFNTLGQVVATLADEQKDAGYYQVQWNATDVPSGIYFYRLQAGEFVETKRMILLK